MNRSKNLEPTNVEQADADAEQQPLVVLGQPADKVNDLPENKVDHTITDSPIMEVHHPHHLTHKKKWSEFVLEFLMLFFAVFLGFLVENYREHRVEEERTEKHMHTMVEKRVGFVQARNQTSY